MHSIRRAMSWDKPPGNWDRLNSREVFPADNDYGLPTIGKQTRMPARLLQWGSRPELLAVEEGSKTAVHFFLDDYRFESLWRDPMRNLDALRRIGLVLSPDFSLWRDMPMAMQLWQVYRNRWIGCYWQAHGIAVIPTISWSSAYDFCYMGVERGSIVAISTVGVVRDTHAHRLFREGFEQMIEVLQPEAILCYGALSPLGIDTDVPLVIFPTRWQERKPTVRADVA